MKYCLSFFVLLFTFFTSTNAQNSKTIEFRNASWYNGKDFTAGTWYAVGGVLSQKIPAKIDTVIDLENRWVVPPLADVHSSSLAGNPSAADVLKFYMGEGVFYVQILSNSQEQRKTVEALTNRPNTPDAVFANGGLTCTLGVPFLRYEAEAWNVRGADMIKQRYEQIRLNKKMHGDGYWFIDNKDALNKNWNKIKEQKPGVISIYLLDVENSGGKEGKGLTADMAKAIVKKAHKSDLRVFAHVETVEDVRLGIKLGVDGFANLPGHDWDGTGDKKRYELDDNDLKKIAKKKIFVTPVFSHAQMVNANPTALEFQKQTLNRMFGFGVPVVIGSDDLSRTIRTELNWWFQLGGLNATQALKTLCETSPHAVFPDRKIGKIAEGYEASFLVLADNPLQNILKLRAISYKVKNGVILK